MSRPQNCLDKDNSNYSQYTKYILFQEHCTACCIQEVYYRPQTKFAKVMFLHVFVSHSVHRGGGSASVHAGIPPHPTPGPAPPQEQAPPPPGTRHPQSRPPPQEQTPSPGADPPRSRLPCTVHTGRYGQQADGMHPTEMQSCYIFENFL